jgi:hypothetical protein
MRGLRVEKAIVTSWWGTTAKKSRDAARSLARPTSAKTNQREETISNQKGEGNMNIRKYLGTSVLSVALLLASGIPGLAKNSGTVTLQQDAILKGTTLPAGKYHVRWETHSPEATIEFIRGNKVVISTEGRVEQRDKSYNRNAAVYSLASDGSRSLVEIRFAASKAVLVFNQ